MHLLQVQCLSAALKKHTNTQNILCCSWPDSFLLIQSSCRLNCYWFGKLQNKSNKINRESGEKSKTKNLNLLQPKINSRVESALTESQKCSASITFGYLSVWMWQRYICMTRWHATCWHPHLPHCRQTSWTPVRCSLLKRCRSPWPSPSPCALIWSDR